MELFNSVFPPSYFEFILRVAMGGLCGLIIGIDREIKHKPLGARTFILVAAATAAYMAFTLELVREMSDEVSPDPTRLIQGIVSGIGFLGAGAIMSRSDNHGTLRGTASGAAIWCSGAVGISCGLGMFAHAVSLAVFILFVLTIVEYVLHRIDNSEMLEDNEPKP